MIPIIIVHTGNPFYLESVIKQARIFNPQNDIYLISNDATKSITNGICTHVSINKYYSSANEFEKIYVHRSTNDYRFELFCFQRWFIISDFVNAMNLSECLCIDSDFLLYDNIDSFLPKIKSFDFTTCGDQFLPNCTWFSKESINKFCNFIRKMYLDKHIERELITEYEDYRITGALGGICDMTAFAWYEKYHTGKSFNLTIPRNGVAVDDCYYYKSGYITDYSQKQFLMNRIPKKIIWRNNIPHAIWEETGEMIRLTGIHLQGGAKRNIYQFLVDDNKVRKTGVLYTLKWKFNGEIMKYRWRRGINKINLLIHKK